MHRVVVLGASVLIGGALAALGLWWGDAAQADATQSPSAVVTTTTAPESVPGESESTSIPLGSSILTATELEIDGTAFALHFELDDVAPPIHGFQTDLASVPGFRQVPNLDFNVLAPEKWTLRTTDGEEFEGTTANIRARTARFTVPEGFDESSIESITLDQYRQRVPLVFELTFGNQSGERQVLGPETSVTLASVIEQTSGTIYQFAIEDPFDGFSTTGNIGMDHVSLFGTHAAWISGGPWERGIQLTHAEAQAPETVTVFVESINWDLFPVEISVPLDHLKGATS